MCDPPVGKIHFPALSEVLFHFGLCDQTRGLDKEPRDSVLVAVVADVSLFTVWYWYCLSVTEVLLKFLRLLRFLEWKLLNLLSETILAPATFGGHPRPCQWYWTSQSRAAKRRLRWKIPDLWSSSCPSSNAWVHIPTSGKRNHCLVSVLLWQASTHSGVVWMLASFSSSIETSFLHPAPTVENHDSKCHLQGCDYKDYFAQKTQLSSHSQWLKVHQAQVAKDLPCQQEEAREPKSSPSMCTTKQINHTAGRTKYCKTSERPACQLSLPTAICLRLDEAGYGLASCNPQNGKNELTFKKCSS